MVPMPQMTWGEWKEANPTTLVLSPDTPFNARYRPVRIGESDQREATFGDARLPANTLVVGVEVDRRFSAYPLDALEAQGGVANDSLTGMPIVVLYDPQASTGIAYSRRVEGLVLEFYNSSPDRLELRDQQTDSVWDAQGRALSGPMEGARLEFVPSFISEWYGWSGYHPGSGLWGG